jgi:GT2 family glycosyltransferase
MTLNGEGHLDDTNGLRGLGASGQMGIGEHLPDADVVICAYTTARESLLRRAIASVVEQGQAKRVIVVIDYSSELFGRLSGDESLGECVAVVENVHQQGLSGARNTGIEYAQSDVVVFLDDDACADPGWLRAIRSAHADSTVVGTGGWVAPDWEDGEVPAWLPEEFWWTVGCSYRGLPGAGVQEIRNPIGANMSFRRDLVTAVGGFRSGLGRIGTVPLGCEETEAAIRIRAYAPGGRIVHLTDARVGHYVPRSRTTWSYFRGRCLAEGRSKALVAGLVGTDVGLSSERRYVLRVLPLGVLHGLRDASRGDRAGLYRSGAILAGVSLTAFGYLAGRLEARDVGALRQMTRRCTSAVARRRFGRGQR